MPEMTPVADQIKVPDANQSLHTISNMLGMKQQQQTIQSNNYELQKQQMLAKAAVAKAEGEAQSLLVKAKAEGEANRLLQTSITPAIIQNRTIEKWDGVLPQVTGGSIPMINLKSLRASGSGKDAE